MVAGTGTLRREIINRHAIETSLPSEQLAGTRVVPHPNLAGALVSDLVHDARYSGGPGQGYRASSRHNHVEKNTVGSHLSEFNGFGHKMNHEAAPPCFKLGLTAAKITDAYNPIRWQVQKSRIFCGVSHTSIVASAYLHWLDP